MNFNIFLKEHRTNNLFTTVKDQYINFGGKKNLGISLRHFQQLATGVRVPTELVVDRIFRQVSRKEQKSLLVSFFNSKLPENTKGGIISYLESSLPDSHTNIKGIWDSNKPQMFLSERQIIFLLENPEALKTYFLLSIKKRANLKNLNLSKKLIDEMLLLELIEFENDTLFPTKELLRIPTFQTSSHKTTDLGIQLILKCLDLFIDKRGSAKQKTAFTLQYVPKDMANVIGEQIERLRYLIKSSGIDFDDQSIDHVPILFSAFYKEFLEQEV